MPDNFFVLPSVGAKLEVFRLSWEHTQKVHNKKKFTFGGKMVKSWP